MPWLHPHHTVSCARNADNNIVLTSLPSPCHNHCLDGEALWDHGCGAHNTVLQNIGFRVVHRVNHEVGERTDNL